MIKWSLLLILLLIPITGFSEDVLEKAYDLNRQGMIDMSEAKFEEAVVLFQEAAKLKSDYEITGRPLLYTPIFMSAWAYEKIGDKKNACDAFRLFINRSGASAESTKKDHAEHFIKNYCQ